jgi:hypothetical protein
MDRSLLKGEAPRFSADFTHPLLCERPFKCGRRLVQGLECDKSISNYCTVLLFSSGIGDTGL